MTKVSVSLNDVVPLLEDQFKNGERYKYADISKFLKENFSGINKNQIAGLISRMGTTQIFKKEKSLVGKRYDYIYQGEFSTQITVENSISEKIIHKLSETIKELNTMKIDLNNPEDFQILQKQIDLLEKQIKSL